MEYPLLVEEYSLVTDSAGAGRFRGGMGLRRVVRPRGHDCIFNGAGERFRHPPWGLFGGAPGGMGRFLLRTESGESRLEDKPDQVAIGPDDAVVIETPGAGGFKLPADRTAEAVAGDRATGKFSEEYLNRYYGHLTQMTDREDTDGG